MQLNQLQGALSTTSAVSIHDDSSYYKENKSPKDIQNQEKIVKPEPVEVKQEIVQISTEQDNKPAMSKT